MHAQALQRVLHGERIHHGRQHTHVIAGDAIHAGAGQARSAEDVAATDDHCHLHAHLHELLQLVGDALDDGRFDAVIAFAHQGFAREFHQNAFVRKS